jgi:hypothetical protein
MRSVRFLAVVVLVASSWGCTFSAGKPGFLVEALPTEQAVAVEVAPATVGRKYTFNSWLSFPGVGPWTYYLGDQFVAHAESLERQALSQTGSPNYRLHLELTGYDVSTFYRASCRIRATLSGDATGETLLDRQYVEVGRTAVVRMLFLGFFAVRSAIRATTSTCFDAAFGRVAEDVATKIRSPSLGGEESSP